MKIPKHRKLSMMPANLPAMVEASAGTGKTYLIVQRIIDLFVEHRVRPEQLLVMTFAVDAAAEIKVRVRDGIRDILQYSGPGPGRGEPHWKLTGDVTDHLHRALLTLDQSMIGTIHEFCQALLCDHAFAGSQPLVRAFRDEVMFTKAVIERAMRRDFLVDPELKPFFEALLEAPSWTDSDFTDTLATIVKKQAPAFPLLDPHRARQLLQEFAAVRLPKDWQAAVEECTKDGVAIESGARTRVKNLINNLEEVRVSLSSELKPLLAGKTWSTAQLIDVLGWRDQVVNQLNLRLSAKELLFHIEIPAAAGGMLVEAAEDLAQGCPSRASASLQVLAAHVRARMTAEHWTSGALTYDAMIAGVHHMTTLPVWGEIAGRLRQRWTHGLLDEFQDTDPRQWDIVKRLFLESSAPQLAAVGDPKQAIYGFRGANAHTYHKARATVTGAGGQALSLEENFRATAVMVDACNVLFGNTPVPYFTLPVTYSNVRCGDPQVTMTGQDGRALVPVVITNFQAADNNPLNAPVLRAAQGDWIASEIKSLVATHGLRFRGGKTDVDRELNYDDFFILTTASTDFKGLASWLRRYDIPFVIEAKDNSVLSSPEATDMAKLLKAIADPFNPWAFRAAWVTPFFAIPIECLPNFAGSNHELLLQERLARWGDLANRREYHRLFTCIMTESGVTSRQLATGADGRCLTNLLHLGELLTRHAAEHSADLQDLIDLLELGPDAASGHSSADEAMRSEGEGQAVRITTVHKSKGRQRAVVFVAGTFTVDSGDVERGVEDDQLVTYIAPEKWLRERVRAENLKEWERVLYVAATRARARVYLPHLEPIGDKQNGPIQVLNARLDQLKASDMLSPSLFSIVQVPLHPVLPATRTVGVPGLPKTADAATIAAVLPQPSPVADLNRHAPTFITSYTSLAHGAHSHGESRLDEPFDDEPAEGEVEGANAPGVSDSPPAVPIIRGKRFGIFVHALLDQVPRHTYGSSDGISAWLDDPQVQEDLQRLGDLHGVDAAARELAAQLTHAVMTRPVTLPSASGPVTLQGGLAAVSLAMSESQLLFTYPELGRMVGDDQHRSVMPRGYITGSIDYVFSHDGRVYFADWKTDDIMAPGAEYLQRAFDRSGYRIQAAIYTLGLVRALRIKDAADYDRIFGGSIYCFARRMAAGVDPGTIAGRLSWDELKAYEQELIDGRTGR